jgi:hypothetical protein
MSLGNILILISTAAVFLQAAVSTHLSLDMESCGLVYHATGKANLPVPIIASTPVC